MTEIVTLAARRAREKARRRAAADAIASALDTFARQRGGRFLLFGSAATGSVTEHSDLDVVIDVAPEHEAEAWSFVEDMCRRHDMPGDIHSARTTRAAFLERIGRTARVLG